MTPATIAQRLAASRLAGLTDAVAATLRPLFPGVAVRTHPGRIDVADVIAGDIFLPPMIAIALTKAPAPVAISGNIEIPAELAAYIVTEDMAIAGRSTPRDQVAVAIGQGLLEVLADFTAPRWGLPDITSPQDAEFKPLFSADTYSKGSAYYAVTWKQRLFALGADLLPPVPMERLEAVEDGQVIVVWPEPEEEA